MKFPDGFIWGAATSSYQIEGAAYENGKGASIWDMFCTMPGAIENGDSGEVSCDHYHRYKEDIALMKEIGVKAYRMSVSWPRIIPGGTGYVNEAGLDFYDALTDELLEAGITPYVTLFHWDYPYELYKRGGWLNPDSPGWFGEYTQTVVKTLSDRVNNWFTMNEPQIACCWGHQTGIHAPGLKLGTRELLQVAHNMLMANGTAARVIREDSKLPCAIGEAFVGRTYIPKTDSDEDIKAAKSLMFNSVGEDFLANSLWMEPLFFGEYPEDALRLRDKYKLGLKPRDMSVICQPVDFLGINIYSSDTVRMGEDGKPEVVKKPSGYPKMALENWQVSPKGLYWGPKLFYERYGKPIIVTENGFSGCDWVCLDEKVHDSMRIDYINRYLNELYKAVSGGTDVRGYFYWSAFDDFEWTWGYNERLGLIYVDFETQRRVVKDSGWWYGQVVKENGGNLLKI